ncbi:type VI secretion system baseplate subunit TssF [Vibrio sp. SM6]|uniref:Type VI secretion system baseplate subunit TssF n=1 Tax=Vibrio agarilyticus TaxID=2726741 RepID=A0A7X8TN26_9VIBR|nr:type VI secretion system baseplate subunit TssF [Vibrio agarilyticus]NLS11778.1 type VI secretion system baseplate subunit TssF [Vibrio agarilyticus]
MSEPLLSYFERELTSIRTALGDYGHKYPESASAMRLNQDEQEDPNIRRFIEAAALLSAKTEQRLDEQYPDLVQDLMNMVYPGYLQTIPSYTPLTLTMDTQESVTPVKLSRGDEFTIEHAQLESTFTLADDLIIHPYHIAALSATTAPFDFPIPKQLRRAESAIQLTLRCNDPDVRFSQLSLEHFDFYVQGFENRSRGLIELLLLQTEAISLSTFDQQCDVPCSHLRSRVTDPDFHWLTVYNGHLSEFDLLRDYFAYPDKSAYMRIDALGDQLSLFDCNEVILTFFVEQLPAEYLSLFTPNVLLLNTVPALNIFAQRGEPIRYDFTKLALPIVADAQQPDHYQVVAIESVSEVQPTGEVPLAPIYEGGYWRDEEAPQWQSRQIWDHKGRRCHNISLSYPQLTSTQSAVVLSTQLWVCNGRAPCLITSNTEAQAQVAVDLPGVFCALKTPSAPQYPALDNSLIWRFLALLNANFASLVQSDTPTETLQDVLRLCCPTAHCLAANAIKKVRYQHRVAPMRLLGSNVFASGTEIEVTVDDTVLGSDIAVFAQLLNALFVQHCSYDRFVELKVIRFGREGASIQFAKQHGSQLGL